MVVLQATRWLLVPNNNDKCNNGRIMTGVDVVGYEMVVGP